MIFMEGMANGAWSRVAPGTVPLSLLQNKWSKTLCTQDMGAIAECPVGHFIIVFWEQSMTIAAVKLLGHFLGDQQQCCMTILYRIFDVSQI